MCWTRPPSQNHLRRRITLYPPDASPRNEHGNNEPVLLRKELFMVRQM